MEQSQFNPEQYRALWKEESQQLQSHEIFSSEKVVSLIRSSYCSQYHRRCRNKNFQIMLFVFLLLASFVAFYATLVYSSFFWIIVSFLVMLSLLSILIVSCYERYLLCRIHPYRHQRGGDNLAQLSQKLNTRYQRRDKMLSYFVDMSHPQERRLRWASIVSATLSGVAMVVVFCFIFPVVNSQNSQLVIDNTHNVVCNKKSCDAIKYYQIATIGLTYQESIDYPQNQQ